MPLPMGFLAIISAIRRERPGNRWWLLLLETEPDSRSYDLIIVGAGSG
jgi:hypothetical protein